MSFRELFFGKKPEVAPAPSNEIAALVREALGDADEDTHKIVVAIVGLAGVVAYADRDFSETEKAATTSLLSGIHGISHEAAERVVAALSKNLVTISTTEAARHTRALLQLADRDLRVRVLDLLLDIATADGKLSQEEVVTLRQLTKALGLEQGDYNLLQARHRPLLHALK
jgi:uncharacterized tellurite resistance protein B-like protein